MAKRVDEKIYVALLRGINVGGKNKLPMADLRSIFTGVGCGDVRTYIQSGNVLFRASKRLVERVPAVTSREILSRFELAVPVLVRGIDELRSIRDGNPFLMDGEDPATLHVVFLEKKPAAEQVGALDPERSPPDRFVLRGREIYLFCPKGMARTKLTNAYWDRALKTTSTVRNWKTLGKLIELGEK